MSSNELGSSTELSFHHDKAWLGEVGKVLSKALEVVGRSKCRSSGSFRHALTANEGLNHVMKHPRHAPQHVVNGMLRPVEAFIGKSFIFPQRRGASSSNQHGLGRQCTCRDGLQLNDSSEMRA